MRELHVRLESTHHEQQQRFVAKTAGLEPEDGTSDGHLSSDDVDCALSSELDKTASSTTSFCSLDGEKPHNDNNGGRMDGDDNDGGNNQINVQEWEFLQQANEQLRNEVADLTSALVARDMEIASLRERCQFLMSAVEQQDAVIAKIYATAGNGPDPPHVRRTSQQMPEKKDAVKKVKKKGNDSVRGYPGAIAMMEPAREMLEARLDVIGFQGGRVDAVLESLSEGHMKKLPVTRNANEVEVLNAAMDRLLYPSPPPLSSSSSKSFSLFGAAQPAKNQSSPASPENPLRKRRHSLERSESFSSEQDFAMSAGFLRKPKPNRRMSGRLSVSDFGLLEDNNSPDKSRTLLDRQTSTTSEKSSTGGDGSQRNLFGEIDFASNEDTKRKGKGTNAIPITEDEKEDNLTYAEFLERVSLPASRDILDSIRTFVGSVLGPRGNGKPPRSTDYTDYEFYGNHEFRRRCEYFFQRMDDTLLNHPAWRHASESILSKARDGIEKYVMDKLGNIAFNQLPECAQWKEEDERLLRRMKILSFVTPDMLDIKPCMRNEVVWSMAEDELRRINSFRSPGDKINCIVRCCSVIFSVLNLSRGDSGSRPGADDFLPVFIYIVLHSHIPRLHSNCEYIAAYRNPADLMSKAGYCFVNLRSAIEFIMVLDGSMLSISAEEFKRLYSEREKQLNN